MRLTVKELTPSAFEPYGQVIGVQGREPDGKGPGWRWWAETVVIPEVTAPYTVGYLELAPDRLRFDWAEYHLQSAEMIVPMGADCLVYVGPQGEEPYWSTFEVFRVRAGQGVILNRGVWHGAPLAVDRPTNAIVLLRQGTGEDDVYKAIRADGPIEIVEETHIATSGG